MNVSSINYDNPSNVQYTWKLEGFYDEWTPPSDNGLICYNQLITGQRYPTRKSHFIRQPSGTGRTHYRHLTVGRPFWLTFWAFLVYATLIIGSIYLWFRYQHLRRKTDFKRKDQLLHQCSTRISVRHLRRLIQDSTQ